jgi:hypothetical protein
MRDSNMLIQNSVYEGMTPTEIEVAEFLNELKQYWVFESPVFVYDTEKRPRVWTPDFYLPNLGMHVEVWNSEMESHEYREKVYKKNGYHVIYVHVFKTEWKNFLVSRITAIENRRHSEVMDMLLSMKLK